MSSTSDSNLDPTELTGSQAVAHIIASEERPIVYGMPGGYTGYIYDALFSLSDKIETYLVRQESIATVMAEAQGRLTGRPAFVMAQGAWVLGNAGIGVMEAKLGASPMVLLIDATDGGAFHHLGPYQGGLGSYGSYDLPAAMKAITKQTYVATDPTQAVQMTQLAIKHATTGEPGPVAVIFNVNSLVKRIRLEGGPQVFMDRSYDNVAPPTASAEALTAAATLIKQAQRPVIIAGNGVRLAKAETTLVNFAESHAVPVVTTPGGKGVFPENNDLAAGVIGGFGHDAANSLVGDADLILAVGTKLGASDTANANPSIIDPKRQRMVQIDVEPLNLSWTFPIDAPVQGDVMDALPRLSQAIAGYRSNGVERATQAREGTVYFDLPIRSKPDAMMARDVVRIMSETMPPETVVTCDAGENRLFVLNNYQSKLGGTVLQPNGGGGMGYAVPSAMSAAMNCPGRPAVAVCGDGGIGMSLHGLLSAVELGLKMIVVVLDNSVLGWVYSAQGERAIASEFKDIDYATIASAIGCHACSVSDLDGFQTELDAANARDGVSLIVAKVTTDDRYQDIIASVGPDVYSLTALGRDR